MGFYAGAVLPALVGTSIPWDPCPAGLLEVLTEAFTGVGTLYMEVSIRGPKIDSNI